MSRFNKVLAVSPFLYGVLAAPQVATNIPGATPTPSPSPGPGPAPTTPVQMVTDFKTCLMQYENKTTSLFDVLPEDFEKCTHLVNVPPGNGQDPTTQQKKRDDNDVTLPDVPPDPPLNDEWNGLILDTICNAAAPVLSTFMQPDVITKNSNLLARQACTAANDAFQGAIPGAPAVTKVYTAAQGIKKIAATFHGNEKMDFIMTFINSGLPDTSKIYDMCVMSLEEQAKTCIGSQNSKSVVKPEAVKWLDGAGALVAMFDLGWGNGGTTETP